MMKLIAWLVTSRISSLPRVFPSSSPTISPWNSMIPHSTELSIALRIVTSISQRGGTRSPRFGGLTAQ